MQLAEMLAREAIRKTLSIYNFAVDRADFAALREVFLPEATMTIQGSPTIAGIDAIIRALSGGSRSGSAFRDGRFQRHNLTSSLIDFADGDNASGEHYVLVVTELGVDHNGRYLDRYVRNGDRWLIQHRAASMEWARPDSRFVRWLGTPRP